MAGEINHQTTEFLSNKIGLDVALEALREAWNGKHATIDELWHDAEICRVANVMRPYQNP